MTERRVIKDPDVGEKLGDLRARLRRKREARTSRFPADKAPGDLVCICDKSHEWHKCRGSSCFVPDCHDSLLGNRTGGPNSLAWGKVHWCHTCGGTVFYTEGRDTILQGDRRIPEGWA